MKFNPEVRGLLEMIRGELRENGDLYLIGGGVRDAFMDRKINDLDFAMNGDPTSLAKRIAKRLKVGFFVLNDERHTARVLYRSPEGDLSPLDFVQFTGGGLNADLQNRDFTINAMAVSIRDLGQLIDPLDGRTDLAERLLRPCSGHALLDDPVRVLRGIRLVLQFDLDFVEGLQSQMRTAARLLPVTSYERQRDEFFKILEGPDPAKGMQHCLKFSVFNTLIPPLTKKEKIPVSPPHTLPLVDHAIKTVAAFGKLLDCIQDGGTPQNDSEWWLSHAAAELSQFSSDVETFFVKEITLGRTRRGLALLGALLHDIGKSLTMKTGDDENLHYYGHARVGADLAWETARRLRLSNAEAGLIQTMVRHHMDLLPLVNERESLSRQAIYQFFNKTEEIGIVIALLSLADTQATYNASLSREKWERAVRVTKALFFAWWEHRGTVVSPPLLLDGDDLQKEFDLAPGKQIGQLLEFLREAQAVGRVNSLEEAKNFIRSRINQQKSG